MTSSSGVVPYLQAALERAGSYASQARAPATLRGYQSDWREFGAWVARSGAPTTFPVAPAVAAAHLAELADNGRQVATILRRLAALSRAHELAGFHRWAKDPALSEVVRGIKRGLAARGARPRVVDALSLAELRSLCTSLGSSPAELRDRAILVMGWAGAFRRSELASLRVGDIVAVAEGLEVTLRRSKTDQEG